MSDDSSPPPTPGRDALKVWLQLAAFLVGLVVFGWITFSLSRALH